MASPQEQFPPEPPESLPHKEQFTIADWGAALIAEHGTPRSTETEVRMDAQWEDPVTYLRFDMQQRFSGTMAIYYLAVHEPFVHAPFVRYKHVPEHGSTFLCDDSWNQIASTVPKTQLEKTMLGYMQTAPVTPDHDPSRTRPPKAGQAVPKAAPKVEPAPKPQTEEEKAFWQTIRACAVAETDVAHYIEDLRGTPAGKRSQVQLELAYMAIRNIWHGLSEDEIRTIVTDALA